MINTVIELNEVESVSKFQHYLNDLSSFDFTVLPINHITNVSSLSLFARSKVINCDYLEEECEVFKKHLIYCFYGKPAFRLKNNNFYPICLIFEHFIYKPFKLFPFDSGAYNLGLMSPFFDSKEIKLEDFEIDPNYTQVNKIVGHFFGSNSRYYQSKSKKDVLARDKLVEGYIKMLNNPSSTTLDDRKNSIEVIFENDFDLSNNNLKMIVIPKTDYTVNGVVVEFDQYKLAIENSFNCSVKGYEMTRPQESYLEIDKIVNQYCKNSF